MRRTGFVTAAYLSLFVMIGAALLTATETNWKVVAVVAALATMLMTLALRFALREQQP
jgi:hypothetical protein